MSDWFEDDDFWRDFFPVMFSSARFEAAVSEVAHVLALAKITSGNVLDLCCGPGRHSVVLARAGFAVTGIDRSPFLLEHARTAAQQAGVQVDWVQEDMRTFKRENSFDLVCSLFTSFGYFEDETDNLRVLQNVCANLRSGGVFVMELLGKERLARSYQPAICSELPDGTLWL